MHLGSDLGPAAGGRIRAGRLVCPFHGYEYDASGQCVATPYADPPRTAKLRVFETQEIAGLVFTWWGIGGREPQWSLHPDFVEEAGWSDHAITTLRFPGHPQDTTENSVDMAHFRYAHGYGNVDRSEPVVMDGPYLESRFEFRRIRRIAKLRASPLTSPSAPVSLGWATRTWSSERPPSEWICVYGYSRHQSTARTSTCRWSRRCARYASRGGAL